MMSFSYPFPCQIGDKNMKVTGIIAEYNPFHKGHAYHIQQAKKVTGADAVVVVMSGDFTQRGTPAIIDKYARAKMALLNGADIILEIPSCYACGSAEYFADGAIALLDSLGVVDSICFGSECGDIELLRPIAELLANEPREFKEILRNEMKNGATYPQARNIALSRCVTSFAENENIIGSPNNILGIEYMKSLIRRGSKIKPYTIQRTGADYHSYRLDQNFFPSSLALRQSLDVQKNLDLIRQQVPENVYEILQEEFDKHCPIFPRDFSSMLNYKLLVEESHGYTSFVDINDDVSDRILKHIYQSYDYEKLCDVLKTKNLTYVRVSRMLCHILLNLRKSDVESYRENGTIFYARVLGFKDDEKNILGLISENSEIPVITRVSEWRDLDDELAQKQFERDLLASHIYESVAANKYGTKMRNEYERQLIKL